MTKLEKAVQQFVFDSAVTSHIHVKSVTYSDNDTATIEYEQTYYDCYNECWQSLNYEVTLNENGDIL